MEGNLPVAQRRALTRAEALAFDDGMAH
jgi:hypothetical protein